MTRIEKAVLDRLREFIGCLDHDGLPVDAKDWAEEDWADLRKVDAVIQRIKARHADIRLARAELDAGQFTTVEEMLRQSP